MYIAAAVASGVLVSENVLSDCVQSRSAQHFEFEFLLIESTPLLISYYEVHNKRRSCASKAGPDVRAFQERTGQPFISTGYGSILYEVTVDSR